tara:strand:+ start:377 stop:1138 length:762 start_codon:yes stop_codon:yes gene_type:complete
MAGIRNLDSGKIYIGPEGPKVDQSKETLDGDKEFEGTLAAVGPVFLGEHSDVAFGNVNIGTSQFGFTNFKPAVKGLALSVEGDVEIAGDPNGDNYPNAVVINGDLLVTGDIDGGNKGRLASRFATADSLPKPFDMVHPTKGEGHRLRYACIEGPEVGVYFRGRTQDNEIVLPDYWRDLVVIDTITVQTQPVGSAQNIIVKEWDDDKITLEGVTDCFYHVYGERKDVNPLVVEYEGNTWEDYPDPKYNDPAYSR